MQLLSGSFCSLSIESLHKLANVNCPLCFECCSRSRSRRAEYTALDTRASVGAGATGQSPGWPARYRERSTALWELGLCPLSTTNWVKDSWIQMLTLTPTIKLNATAILSPEIRVSTPQVFHSALDRYAMARKYAGINVKTQEAAAAITHRHTFRAQSRKTSCAVVLCFFRSVLSTWSLHSFKNDTWLLGT